MSKCGCEGSCPICRLGEVNNHKCDRCKTEFCNHCHGIAKDSPTKINDYIKNCECK